MTLQTMGRSKERVLAFGMEGTGKSLLALDVAVRCYPAVVHVIDNDNAWDRMLEGETLGGESPRVLCEMRWNGKDFDADYEYTVEGGNIMVWHVWGADDEWTANTAAMEAVREEVITNGSGRDWIVLDTGTLVWSAVQDWFVEKVFGKTIEDYFLQVRMEKAAAAKDSKALGALDGWMDWPVINKEYAARMGKLLVAPPCNLLVTAELAEISKEDDSQTRALYSHGVKPKGQKRLGHNMQTVLMLRRDRGDSFYASTLKDRGGRERLENADVTGYGFGEWYLEEVGGWVEVDGGMAPGPVIPASAGSAPVPKTATKIVAKG